MRPFSMNSGDLNWESRRSTGFYGARILLRSGPLGEDHLTAATEQFRPLVSFLFKDSLPGKQPFAPLKISRNLRSGL